MIAAVSVVISIVVHGAVMFAVMMLVMLVPRPRGGREQYDAKCRCKSDGSFTHDNLHRVIDQ